jgi:hypothetical protein
MTLGVPGLGGSNGGNCLDTCKDRPAQPVAGVLKTR